MTDFFNLYIHRNHRVSTDWQWHTVNSANMPEDYFEIKGAVPIGTISRGPRKGSPKWPKESQRYFVKWDDFEKLKLDWELETGKCYVCDGTGQELIGSSVSEGDRYRQCKRCGGSGRTPQQPQPEA
jgi:hypothetical protein